MTADEVLTIAAWLQGNRVEGDFTGLPDGTLWIWQQGKGHEVKPTCPRCGQQTSRLV